MTMERISRAKAPPTEAPMATAMVESLGGGTGVGGREGAEGGVNQRGNTEEEDSRRRKRRRRKSKKFRGRRRKKMKKIRRKRRGRR